MMAICQDCKQEMLNECGCTKSFHSIDGQLYEKIKYGNEDRLAGELARSGKKCPECNCPPFTYHHPSCERGVCPKCECEFIECECRKE